MTINPHINANDLDSTSTFPNGTSENASLNETTPSANNGSMPQVAITDPIRGSTIPFNDIIVNGTAYDKDDGIEKVEVVIGPYPLVNTGIQHFTAIPPPLQKNHYNSSIYLNGTTGKNKWVNWSIPAHFEKEGVYGIYALATDKNGNSISNATNVYLPFSHPQNEHRMGEHHNQTRIALVNPMFTRAAYSDNAFYQFYSLYNEIEPGQKVDSNLSMLNARIEEPVSIDPSKPYDIEKNLSEYSQIDMYNSHVITLYNHIKNHTSPNARITIIKDQDIHNGYIFSDNGRKEKNAFDLLILFHDEYATKQMYYNYKKFVENGGKIIFIDPNVFYAEVIYNKSNNTITLVKGHDWFFDGKTAQKDVSERWFKETNKWVGSNYMKSEIKDNLTFNNNPFNYTHFEENFVNNPNVTVIIDYEANLPTTSPYSGATIATYSLDYAKGKVIMVGLYGERLINNQKFLDFFDTLLQPLIRKTNNNNL